MGTWLDTAMRLLTAQNTSQNPVKTRAKNRGHGRSVPAPAPRLWMCSCTSIKRLIRLHTPRPCEQHKLHRCSHRTHSEEVQGATYGRQSSGLARV